MNTSRNIEEANIVPFQGIPTLAKKLIPDLLQQRVALSGGSTYAALCTSWRRLAPALDGLFFLPVDERITPFASPESNWGEACRTLFFPCNRPDVAQNHPQSVADYERLCNTCMDTEGIPRLDTVFLGVGDDGHCASIFPGTPAAQNFTSPFLATESPRGIRTRITLGFKTILAARTIHMVITGTQKKCCVEWLLQKQPQKPFVQVLLNRTDTHVHLDEALYEYYKNLRGRSR
ncbi:6-phosphogluconolactonase [Chitinivibrio alkaliphilus]|uniref:6-phosphogluconolactonase n=1 Tax=Chitinivibrio alkaliphilus ACht1 TaxID=1313304 RepID=U7DDP6_9BACT|nr:6-phosphogluconolactonase [Chitinivibrio alkaliphilus]ERP39016.1 6-phosphogluconolactonase [Chitinivibrio alkaliphilus ACht1]